MMKSHGLRRIFSLLLAVIMICALLPTAAFAEDTTETESAVAEVPQPEAPQEPKQEEDEQPEGEISEEPKQEEAEQPEGEAPEEPAISEAPVGESNGVATQAVNVSHTIKVTFKVLYLHKDFKGGYKFGDSEAATLTCQSAASNKHEIAISDIKAAAGRASVTGNYSLVGWSKNAAKNPDITGFDAAGTTVCQDGDTIYLVAQLKDGGYDRQYRWNFTLRYDANGGVGAPTEQFYGTAASREKTHQFVIRDGKPTRKGYVFKGWSETKDGSAAYQPGGAITVEQTANGFDGGNVIKTLYAVWEEAVPSKPKWNDILGELRGNVIRMNCTNSVVNHSAKTYEWIDNTGNKIGDVQGSAGSYTCTVTVGLGAYLNKYNLAVGGDGHWLLNGTTASIVLKYTDTGWVRDTQLPIDVTVTCGSTSAPGVPGEDVLNKLVVSVACGDRKSHGSKSYKVYDGDYELKKVNDNTYTVTIKADKYVEKYNNTAYPGHAIPGDSTKTITLKYNQGAWTPVGSNSVTFTVSCEEKYTVTYKDGVNGTVFQDDIHSKLKANTPTPAFTEGTPTRPGYTFTGWDPAVADTVTGNAVYTAMWEAAQPALPDAIFGSFIMKCVTPNANHYCREGVDIDLAPLDAYTNSGVKTDDSGDTPVYYFELTVDAEKYLPQYDGKAFVTGKEPIKHTICAGQEPTVIRFNWDGSSWVQGNKPVVNAECKNEPEKPSDDIVKPLIEVQVKCKTNEDHPKTTSSLNDGTFDIGDVREEGSQYTCVITVYAKSYVDDYNIQNPGHVLTPNTPGLTVTLVHTANDWALEDGAGRTSVSFDVSDTYTVTYKDGVGGSVFPDETHTVVANDPTPAYNGTAPTRRYYNFAGWSPKVEATVTENATYTARWEDKRELLVKEMLDEIKVKCVADNSHEVKVYDTSVGGFSAVTTQDKDGKFTSTITVTAAGYVDKYNTDASKTHRLAAGEAETKTVVLEFDESFDKEKVTVKSGELPVTFQVTCEEAPEKPGLDDLKLHIIDGVKVHCVTAPEAHGNQLYALDENVYDVTESTLENGQYTCVVTVKSGHYLDSYNANADGGPHTISGAASEDIKLIWDSQNEKWAAADGQIHNIVFNVQCKTHTVTYTDGVDGVEVFEDVVHGNLPYGVKTPAFGAKDPTREGYVFGGWNPAVADKVTENKTYTATWKVDANGNGIPDDEEDKYTVTYTDGADGKVFTDKVYNNLLSGTATPKFDGTPKRDGYVFGGWNPAVADKVTGSQTYTATWKVDANGNGIADDEEDKYTVTYTDGAKGKAFKDQVYDNLLSGTATPKFDGKPTRKGYTFVSWTPKVTDTVTKTVTYTATWKSNSGKDNVPKTGDGEIVLVLGGVLLFSFCGAAAVCFFDWKRKHI